MDGIWDWWQCFIVHMGAEDPHSQQTKLAPNFGKNHIAIIPTMSKKLVTLCNHLFMDVIQVKQNSIGDEWMASGNGGSAIVHMDAEDPHS